MPTFRSADAVTFETHGSRFSSFVTPSRGSTSLCAWRLDVPAGSRGVAHRPSREEVVLVLDGRLIATVDGVRSTLHAGDVLLVPADSELQVDTGDAAASAWVTTTPGLEAALPDGSRLAPPWAS